MEFPIEFRPQSRIEPLLHQPLPSPPRILRWRSSSPFKGERSAAEGERLEGEGGMGHDCRSRKRYECTIVTNHVTGVIIPKINNTRSGEGIPDGSMLKELRVTEVKVGEFGMAVYPA